MTDVGFNAAHTTNDGLIRKALKGAVWVAPFSTAALTQTELFSATTGVMQALPVGFKDVGWTDSAGFKLARSVSQSELTPFGASSPVRTDTTADSETVDVVCWETKLAVLGLARGFDTTAYATTADAGGSVWIPKPELPKTLYYRVVVAAEDEDESGEYVIGRYYPKMAVTDFGDQTLADGDSPISWEVTLTSYYDSESGFSAADFIGGDGWLANIADTGFTPGGA